MADGHVQGFKGYVEILSAADDSVLYNLTPHIPGYNQPNTDDTIEDTGLQPDGDQKTYLSGLGTGTFDVTVRQKPDGEFIFVIKAIKATATKEFKIREFPAGKEDGNYAEVATFIFTNPGSKTVMNNGLFEITIGAQRTGEITSGVWDANGEEIVDPS